MRRALGAALSIALISVAACASRASSSAGPAITRSAAPRPGWASLPLGTLPVGVRRQMLVNVWYTAIPSPSPPMTIADYLQVPGNPALEPAFMPRLAAHVRRVLLDETVGDDDAPADLERLLRQPTLARRDAAAAAGAFPLVPTIPGSAAAGSPPVNAGWSSF